MAAIKARDQTSELPTRKPPPIGIVEIVLGALVLYLTFLFFFKDEERLSRFRGEAAMVAEDGSLRP